MSKNNDEKVQKQIDKAAATAAKTATKTAQEQLKAEIERVKGSDLSNAEKKIAIASLKNVQTGLKSAS